MRFNLTITLGNDAMQTGTDVADALRKAAKKLEDAYGIDYIDEWSGLGSWIYDANGNKIGKWGVSESESAETI